MIYVGVDPGAKGGYAVISTSETGQAVFAYPWDDDFFAMEMASLMQFKEHGIVAAVEKVGAMPGQGVSSMFSFGRSYGFIQGVLTAFGIPYQLVPPRKWKAEFGLLNTSKDDSVRVAKRLFPGVNLLPSERCRKDSDGMSDSLLMAEYARRHFGEGYVE